MSSIKPPRVRSQAELLAETIERLEQKHGKDDHYVQLLRAQLDSLRRQEEQRRTGVYRPNPCD